MSGNLAGCGRTPQLVGQLLAGPFELRIELFEPAGNLDRPSMIAEVSANFAHHGRNGERQKIRTVLSVEAVHRLNQPHSCHLDEVFERFTAITEPACDVVGQRQTAFDDHNSLALVLNRLLIQHDETAAHIRHVGILRSRL
jgi:hypothetical protein